MKRRARRTEVRLADPKKGVATAHLTMRPLIPVCEGAFLQSWRELVRPWPALIKTFLSGTVRPPPRSLTGAACNEKPLAEARGRRRVAWFRSAYCCCGGLLVCVDGLAVGACCGCEVAGCEVAGWE